MKKDFLSIYLNFFKNLFSVKKTNSYKKKQYLSPARKIYLELHFRRENIIGFSLSEIVLNRKKNFLTNIYFYPSNNVYWLLFLEINSKRFLITREVLKTLFLCFFVVQFLNNEFKSFDKNNAYFTNQIIIQKLKKISKNIKVTYYKNS